MQFDPVLIAARLQPMTEAGYWRNETINDFMAQAMRNCPDKPAIVAYRSDRDQPTRLSYAQLEQHVLSIARSFTRMGIGPADLVTFQLPNWWEFIAVSLACARVGAVANPVMPIFRQRELKFILDFGESKLFIVPKQYKGYDYEAMAHDLLPTLQCKPQLVVVDGSGSDSFQNALLSDTSTALPDTTLQANDVNLLMYTSGTTGEPKGVMHTSNTLFSNLRGFIQAYHLDADAVILGASPMAHLTGFGYLAMIPLILNGTTVLQDVWEPKQALQLIHDESVSFSMASSPFVADLCAAAEAGGPVSDRFVNFCCAGAPIPPVVIEKARNILGLSVSSAWGMTECGAVTVTEPERSGEKSGSTDGKPLPGIEVKIVDASGKVLPTGQTGFLLVRGNSMFGGYLKRPHLNATDADGWFETGDMAYLDDEGYIRINGRSKDIVIRGGENIPVMEIENLLYKHPAVLVVAIVGYPDARLGERACAFVTVRPGHEFSLQEMTRYLSDCKVARQYHPERLELMEDLPKTPSGKLQKFKLREAASAFGANA